MNVCNCHDCADGLLGNRHVCSDCWPQDAFVAGIRVEIIAFEGDARICVSLWWIPLAQAWGLGAFVPTLRIACFTAQLAWSPLRDPGAIRGARGGMACGEGEEGGGVFNVIKDEFLKV